MGSGDSIIQFSPNLSIDRIKLTLGEQRRARYPIPKQIYRIVHPPGRLQLALGAIDLRIAAIVSMMAGTKGLRETWPAPRPGTCRCESHGLINGKKDRSI